MTSAPVGPPPPYPTLSNPAENPLLNGHSTWTADQLMSTRFPEPRWAVPDILSEGVNLLAGPPKIGKSWLVLSLALAVASGGTALGAVPVAPGAALYLALEDTARRLQTRMGRLLGGQPAPSELTLATHCPPLPQGGAAQIAGWLDHHPTARLVIIDVFAKVRGAPPVGASAYDADYAAVGHAKRIADRYGVAVVLVHHLRKASSDDWLTEVSGTNGIAGAADSTLVLKRGRGQADGVLLITGRDVAESEHALSFDSSSGAWHLLDGPVSDHLIGDTRAAILRHVRVHPGVRPKQVADALGLDIGLVRKTCARMADDHQLRRGPNATYYLPDAAHR
ncbi:MULTISPECIES: AAA family ATPase [Streptomycetaceae]|uniref:DNA repair protein RadA n=1 Tax=Streptantibioticus cattleyicolor (strain ATCC 35852 / DSM 46488 / JCM 4925 / NBRC 14057 / NRRL 8057) TaxID=1003195 RepID=G8WPV1_STREN|nr:MULTISPECIES: AAA family ATPase [Streptomycetaceae]AEW92890.1 DNA repair protein RadA [Streptantibioticus cattleyicolor NRRL 8057 = DSM 46488]MYS57641.1 AAA family ATPase [Streptomyces sp. SID5468]